MTEESVVNAAATESADSRAAAARAGVWGWVRDHRVGMALFLIVALGGFLRFYRLSKPLLWGDEGGTFIRTQTSYQDLLDKLQTDGFTPLHYEMYWWVGHGMPIIPAVGEHEAVRLVGYPRSPSELDVGKFERERGHVIFSGLEITLTPFWMRVIPATAGTLMILAMYLLGAQMFSWRVGLLAAGLTACSAFMMVYSHDAKMYAPMWLFLTLHFACLFGWLRRGGTEIFLCWILTGVAAVGFHVTAATALAVEPIILMTWRGQEWRRYPLMLMGLAIIASGPIGYYLGFNQWVQRTDEETGNYDANSGLNWVREWNSGRTTADLFISAGSTFLDGWEWPKDQFTLQSKLSNAGDGAAGGSTTRPRADVMGSFNAEFDVAAAAMEQKDWQKAQQQMNAIYVLRNAMVRQGGGNGGDKPGASAYLTTDELERVDAMIRSLEERLDEGRKIVPPWVMAIGEATMALTAGVLLMGIFPWRRKEGGNAHSAWRTGLWLGFWIVVPVYGFYCRSVADFVSPMGAIRGAGIGGVWGLVGVVLGMAAVWWALVFWKPSRRALLAVGGIGTFAVVAFLMMSGPSRATSYEVLRADPAARPDAYGYVQNAHYFSRIRDGVLGVAVMVGMACLLPVCWYFLGTTLRGRTIRLARGLLAAGVILAAMTAVYLVMDAQRSAFREQAAHVNANGDWRKDWLERMVWMPRYLGVVWPAACLAMAVLLLRLPTRAIRYGALAVLVGVNLANGLARMYVGTEPPLDRITTDILDAQKAGSHLKTFTDFYGGADQHPGGAGMNDYEGRYYFFIESGLRMATGIPYPPGIGEINLIGESAHYETADGSGPVKVMSLVQAQALALAPARGGKNPKPNDWGGQQAIFNVVSKTDANVIKQEVDSTPGVDHVVIWQRSQFGGDGTFSDLPDLEDVKSDSFLGMLGPGWTRVSVEDFTARQFWNWRMRGTIAGGNMS